MKLIILILFIVFSTLNLKSQDYINWIANVSECTIKPITASVVSGTTSISVSINAEANSTMIVHIGLKANETTTPPAGWATVVTITGSGTNYQVSYKKTYTSALAETVSFTFSGSSNKLGLCYYVQNCTNVSRENTFSSSLTYTGHTVFAEMTEYECRTYLSSVLINSGVTPTITTGENWSSMGGGVLNTWGYGAQKHLHETITGNGIPTTYYDFRGSYYYVTTLYTLY